MDAGSDVETCFCLEKTDSVREKLVGSFRVTEEGCINKLFSSETQSDVHVHTNCKPQSVCVCVCLFDTLSNTVSEREDKQS